MTSPTRIRDMRTTDLVRRFKCKSSQSVEKYDIIRVRRLEPEGAYLTATKAVAGELGVCYMAMHRVTPDNYVEVTATASIPFDTSSANFGDPVYLNESTPGSLQLTAGTYGEVVGIVGRVGTVANGGLVWFCYGDLSASTVIAPHSLDNHTDVTISSPSAGKVLYHNGSSWVDSLIYLNTLGDVSTAGLTSGDVLKYNGAAWVPDTLAFTELSDVTITAPTTGDFLIYSAGTWVNRVAYLGDIFDVNSGLAPSVNQVLYWTGAQWNAGNASSLVSLALDDLTDVSIGSPQNGGLLAHNGAGWGETQDWRPDFGGVRATVTTDGTVGGETIYVNNISGSDTTGTGASGAPFATLVRAIKAIPRSRDDFAEGKVWVHLENTGSDYTLPYTVEGLSGVGIYGELPSGTACTVSAISATPAVNGVLEVNTTLAYAADDERCGGHIALSDGSVCPVYRSYSNGAGGTFLWLAVADSSSASTATGAATFYSPETLVNVRPFNTNADKTLRFRSCVDLTFKHIEFFSNGTPNDQNLVLESSEVELISCCIGKEHEGSMVDRRSVLRLENTVFLQESLMGGGEDASLVNLVDNYGDLTLAGVCNYYNTASSTKVYPFTLRHGSRTNFEGMNALRDAYAIDIETGACVGDAHVGSTGISLSNGAPWLAVYEHSTAAGTQSAVFRVGNSEDSPGPLTEIMLPNFRYGSGGHASYGLLEMPYGAGRVWLPISWVTYQTDPANVPGTWGDAFRFDGTDELAGAYGTSENWVRLHYGYGSTFNRGWYRPILSASGTLRPYDATTFGAKVTSAAGVDITLDKLPLFKEMTFILEYDGVGAGEVGLQAVAIGGGTAAAVWPDINNNANPTNVLDNIEAAGAGVQLTDPSVIILKLIYTGASLWVISVLQPTAGTTINGWLTGPLSGGSPGTPSTPA